MSTNYITFPVKNKKPIVPKWTELTEKVPHGENQDYGILCGPRNNVMVIDCDRVKPTEDSSKYMCGVEAWKKLEGKYLQGIPLVSVETKNKGKHYFFRFTDRLKSGIQNVNNAFWETDKTVKIDVLSTGKYVVGPGSEGYTFLQGEALFSSDDLPVLPDEVIEFLMAPVEKKKTPKTAKKSEDEKNGVEKKIKEEKLFKKVSFEELKNVVRRIPAEKADSYEDWCKVIWAIANTGKKNGYYRDALEVADTFSRQSSKYVSKADVEKVFEKCNGSVTFGTLKQLATDMISDDLDEINTEILVNDINDFTDIKNTVSITRIVENKDTKIFSLKLKDESEKNILVYKKNLVAHDKEFIGFIQKVISVPGDEFSVIHSEFKGGPVFCVFEDENTIEFRSEKKENSEHRIRFKNPWSEGKRSYITNISHGKAGKMVSKKIMLDVLRNVVETGCYQVFRDRYNMIINMPGGIINNYGSPEDESDMPRTDFELIQDLLEECPYVLESFKFCNASKTDCFDGLFVCSSETGIWKIMHNAMSEDVIREYIKDFVPNLTEKELRYVNNRANIPKLRKELVGKIYDEKFFDKVDENQDIFVLQNGVFDLNTKELRKTLPVDYAMTSADWKYSKELSDKHMDAVEKFFVEILPVKEERTVLLTYIASLLHGHRVDKAFVVLTDKRQGNNGKTTLLTFLRVFFGDYLESSTKFFCRPLFANETKNSHDGGLEPMKGKRVALADELKSNMLLDDAFLKNIAGGSLYIATGREMGSKTRFKFKWQAGVIMVFNENDCPKFDSKDNALMNRMIVCPMRSKFTNDKVVQTMEEYSYEQDALIHKKFPEWRSAFLDYLIPFCNESGLSGMNIPTSMKEWKDDIIINNNEVGDWLNEITEPGSPSDYVALADLKDKYIADSNVAGKRLSPKEFVVAAKGMFIGKGLTFKERHTHRENGRKKEKRNVILGLKIKDLDFL